MFTYNIESLQKTKTKTKLHLQEYAWYHKFFERNHCFLCTRNKALGFNPKCAEKEEKNHGNITLIESKLLTRQLHNNTESWFYKRLDLFTKKKVH